MLASSEEFLVFWAMLLSFVLVVIVLAQRLKLKLERQKTIQKVLDAPALDDVSRRQVLELLNAQDGEWLRAIGRNVVPALRVIVFVGGWITMFVGGGIAVMSFTNRSLVSERFEATIAAIVGFALVTLPLALRELRSRTERTAA